MDNFFERCSENCFLGKQKRITTLSNSTKTTNVYRIHAVLIIKFKQRTGMQKSKLGYILDCQVCICGVLKIYLLLS